MTPEIPQVKVKIPVTFTADQSEMKGTLDAVFGAGGGIWHLMVNNFYFGRLRLVDRGWAFDSGKGLPVELADYFEGVVTAWYQ